MAASILKRCRAWRSVVTGKSILRSTWRCASTTSNNVDTHAPRAAMLVIGDEILRGSIVDTNTPWLAKLLYTQGVDLVRVEFVPDVKQDIIDTVLRLKRTVGDTGFVFTSGGIGPTHDDVTYEALTTAFGVTQKLHEPTVQLMRESYAKRGMELNDARLRMATLPHPAEVLTTPGTWVPLVNLNGVYILPGIPKLFQSMISAHQGRFTGPTFHSTVLYSVPGESFIADQLTAMSKAHPKVSIGSYPNTDAKTEDTWKVKLALTSRDQDALAAAVTDLKATLPHLTDKPPTA